MSKYRFSKSTVAILTALLIISTATPLLSLATAATTSVSLVTTYGPNGTAVQVTGVGFTPNQKQSVGAPFIVRVDGDTNYAYTTDQPFKVDFSTTNELRTDASGVLSGYFVITGLTVGTHTISISDATHNPAGAIFTVTRPTVALSVPSGAVGTSQVVTGEGFPVSPATSGGPIVTDYIVSAAFPTGVAVTVTDVPFVNTAVASTLSNSQVDVTTGTYLGTVTLQPTTPVSSTTDNTFSITDIFGNTAMVAFGVTAGTASLSSSSGSVGSTVTATVTGFGPGATISHVYFGNGATPSDAIFGGAVTVNQYGTAQVKFKVPADSVNSLPGAKTVLIVDSFGNTATATYTIRAKVSVTVGAAAVSSGTGYVPTTAAAAELFLTASGFTPYTKLSIIGSPGIPANWITFADSDLTTDQYGQIKAAVHSINPAAAPTEPATLSVTVTDGTSTPAPVILTVITLPYLFITPSGASGTTASITGWSAEGTIATATTFDGSAPADLVEVTPAVWPASNALTTPGTFTVPAKAAGTYAVAVTLSAGTVQLSYTVTTTGSVTAYPTSVGVGQSVPLKGFGFKPSATVHLTVDGVTVNKGTLAIDAYGSLSGAFTMPAFLPGNHTIVVTDATTSPIVTATTTVASTAASIQVTPTAATLTTTLPDGSETPTTLAITGTGFKAGETIKVYFDGTEISAPAPFGLAAVNPSGAILLYAGFQLPAHATAGTHTISVVGTGTASATYSITIQPKILITPTALRAGQHFGISASGFASGSALSVALNGTLSGWYNIGTSPETPVTTAVSTGTTAGIDIGSLLEASNYGTMIASSTASGNIIVTVTDAAGHSATATLVVLGDPAIVVSSTNLVPGAQHGTADTESTSISGTGFTTGTDRPLSIKLLSGTTTVASITAPALMTNKVTVGTTGTFGASTPDVTFVVPSTVAAGTYTLQVTVGNAAEGPIETAIATVTVMAAPTLTVANQGAAMANITMTVTGMTSIDVVKLGDTDLVTAGAPEEDEAMSELTGSTVYSFGPVTIDASTNTLTTWFIVPEFLFAGSYTLTVQDTHANVIATAPFEVTPGIAIAVAPVAKGDAGLIVGFGFAPNSRITVTLNGATLNGVAPASIVQQVETDEHGDFCEDGFHFNLPASAVTNNTITVTDASGNTATTYLVIAVPTIIVNPTSAQAGSSVQVIGNGFKAGSSIFVQVGGNVVATTPLSVTATGGSFVCYITIPSTTPQGSTIISATDTSNNQATANFNVTNGQVSTGITVNTTTMSSTAQTTNGAGQATTTFAQGSTVTASFNLVSSNGASGDVVVKVTWQQGAKVYNMASSNQVISTTAKTVPFSNSMPIGVTGTWTATLQVYASDGITPLAVTTLTFTVS